MKEKMRSVQVITKPKEPLEKDIEKDISEPGARQVRVNVSYPRVIAAHGGLDRWNRFKRVTGTYVGGGETSEPHNMETK